MSAAEQLNDGITGDKVSEAQMAELLGTTLAALRSKRARNQIPPASGTSKAAASCTASGDTTNGSKANGFARRNGPPPRIDPHPLYVERQPAQ